MLSSVQFIVLLYLRSGPSTEAAFTLFNSHITARQQNMLKTKVIGDVYQKIEDKNVRISVF